MFSRRASGGGGAISDPGQITVGDALPGRIVEPRLRALLDYWCSKAGERAMPGRSDIDPGDFTSLLGGVALVDVFYAPLRFRYRLAGTRIVDRVGCEMSGRWVSDIPDPRLRELTMKDYELVVHQRAPVLFRGDRLCDGRRLPYEILRLPLSEDGSCVNMVLSAAVYGDD